MFHPSTTIWHNPLPQKNLFTEKRLIYGAKWEAFKSTMSQTKLGLGHLWRIGKRVTYPFRLPLLLPFMALKHMGKPLDWGLAKAEWGLRYGKEVGAGVLKNGIFDSTLELAKAPLYFLKRNLVDNTRDIIKGVFTTPINFAKAVCTGPYHFIKKAFLAPWHLATSPLKTLTGLKNSVVNTVKGVRGSVNKTLSNILGFKVKELAKSTRNTIGGILSAPFKLAWKPIKPLVETPRKVVSNIYKSFYEYPYRIGEGAKHIRAGVDRVLNAHHTVSSEMAAEGAYHLKNIPGSIKSKVKEHWDKAKKLGEAPPALKPAAAGAH
jgi:hypothetical protein